MENHNPIVGIVWGDGGRFDREIEITETITIHFNGVIGAVGLSEGGDLARDDLIPVPEYNNLIHVCFK